MSETDRLILGICILIAVYALTRFYHTWRIKRTYAHILAELKQKGAIDAESAINLPYAKASMFRMGVRDYRPRAVEYLLLSNIIGKTENGKYYVKNTEIGPPA